MTALTATSAHTVPVQPGRPATCPQCRFELWHCHGTLIQHENGASECSEPDCPGDLALHRYEIGCLEIAAPCCSA